MGDPYDQMLGVSWVASVALLLSAVWYGANAQGTMEQQVKVEQLALTDPVKAAQEVLKFHGIFSPNLALWAVFNNISDTVMNKCLGVAVLSTVGILGPSEERTPDTSGFPGSLTCLS